MEQHFCRRCKITLPLLHDTEFEIISPFLSTSSRSPLSDAQRRLQAQMPLDIFEKITGVRLHTPADINHHRLSHFSGECGRCRRLLPLSATVRRLKKLNQQKKLKKFRQLTQLRAIREMPLPQYALQCRVYAS